MGFKSSKKIEEGSLFDFAFRQGATMETKANDTKLIKIADVPAILLELTGVHRQRLTIYNWINKGCRTNDARIVKLKTKKRMGQIFTTRARLEEFIKAVG